jgi:hypothetical protein
VQGELDEKKPHYLMLCDASAKEFPELEEPVCFELEAKTDKMKKLWNEVFDENLSLFDSWNAG